MSQERRGPLVVAGPSGPLTPQPQSSHRLIAVNNGKMSKKNGGSVGVCSEEAPCQTARGSPEAEAHPSKDSGCSYSLWFHLFIIMSYLIVMLIWFVL